MTSVIYDSYMDDVNKSNIDPNVDTFYAMLTFGYAPNKATHAKRSDVTGEVVGTGYTAGGNPIAGVLSLDTVNHRSELTFADVAWPTSSVSATGMAIYKHRGGLATADNLVAWVDFGGTVTSAATTFTGHCTSPLRMQN